MCSYLPYYNSFNKTKGGLIQLNHGRPQPLHGCTWVVLWSHFLQNRSVAPGWYCGPTFYKTEVLREFAKPQIDYILGQNPLEMSYVVGFGQHYPKHVHHRDASIHKDKVKYSCKGSWKWRDSNTIVGALVSGPDKHEGFHDVRTNYNYT